MNDDQIQKWNARPYEERLEVATVEVREGYVERYEMRKPRMYRDTPKREGDFRRVGEWLLEVCPDPRKLRGLLDRVLDGFFEDKRMPGKDFSTGWLAQNPAEFCLPEQAPIDPNTSDMKRQREERERTF